MLGVGNHLGHTARHTQTHHLPHLPPHPAPYDLAHTPDNQQYDPWPEGWDHAPDPIDDNTLRVFLKNPDGIKPKAKDNCNKLDTGLKEFADLGVGIILINEHNSDTKQMEVRDGYRQKLLKHWPKNRTEFSSSTIPARNTYLPGGTLVTILNHWTSRVLSTETNPTKIDSGHVCI